MSTPKTGKNQKGLFTVEAVFIVPLMLFSILGIIYLSILLYQNAVAVAEGAITKEDAKLGKKELKALLGGERQANLSVRNFPAPVSELRKRLRLADGGSIYLFVNIKRTGLTSYEFAHALLERYHILVLPGNAFGQSGEGYVRLALTLGADKIREAFARLPKDRF